MPFLARMVRKPKWYKHTEVSWLPTGRLQADALGDLKTADNKLSVWHIDDDLSNLEQVIAALATTRDDISNLDYILFDPQLLSELDIAIMTTKGNTKYNIANTKWHRDLPKLTANKLIELAYTIWKQGKVKRVYEWEVLDLLKQAVSSGIIDSAQLSEKVRAKVRLAIFEGTVG